MNLLNSVSFCSISEGFVLWDVKHDYEFEFWSVLVVILISVFAIDITWIFKVSIFSIFQFLNFEDTFEFNFDTVADSFSSQFQTLTRNIIFWLMIHFVGRDAKKWPGT